MSARVKTAFFATLVVGLLVGRPAGAVITAAVPQSSGLGYATPQAVTPVGGPLVFVNLDVMPHNVIARTASRPPGSKPWCPSPTARCPLFWSETITAPNFTMVLGLEDTESGEAYEFYCSLHPNMIGTLNVV